ncbi:MAG: hypothetical protein HY014_00410 [Acidobacteria bacterium]|nr:hypothetical protein [Acidobacteriota bacterium]MBI3486614.1 hypothetical protein [Acidobacteriota bacterium]
MSDQEDLHPPFVTRHFALQAAQERQLVAALSDIQWGGFLGQHCPECQSTKAHGHSIGCQVGLALSPDHGTAQLHHAVADAIRDIGTRRRSIQVLVGTCQAELDDLESTLTAIQDLLHMM